MKSLSLTTSALLTRKPEANIEVVPSSTEYRPGDTAQFDITVTDQREKGGSARSCFQLDEAYFAIYPQSINILYSICRRQSAWIHRNKHTIYQHADDYIGYPFAECGEENEGNAVYGGFQRYRNF